jgi:hypothetical protein
MHAFIAFGVAVLVWMRSASRGRTLAALAVTTLLPEVQPLLLGGYCEPLAAATLVIGVVLLSAGDRFFYPGLFVLSLLPLVRPNYLLLWACAAALLWWRQSRDGFGPALCPRRRLIMATLLFYIPSAIWVARNYLVSGAFPVLAGTASTTLYGDYNPASATPGPNFGRWIDPRRIPGEEYPHLVAAGWSEAQILKHYDEQAKKFIIENWKVVPRLVAAHARNSLMPAPEDGAHRYSFWYYRLALYMAVFDAFWEKTLRLNSWFAVLVTAAILISAMTVLVYSADSRYLYPLNMLLLALAFSTPYGILSQANLRPLPSAQTP